MKRMENAILRRPRDESAGSESRKFPVMRVLARLHECDAGTLYDSVDASELDVHEVVEEMVTEGEVEATPGRDKRYNLTLKGWAEYLKVLSSIYELPE